MGKRKRQSKKTVTADNGHADLLKELWQAAVRMRGSIEPADYKRYVLPIIFLRFLSLRYERRREELEKLIADADSDYHTTDPKVAESILEDPDEYRSAGTVIVPAKARWAYLLKNAKADNIRNILDDAMEELERTYPDKLKGLLPPVFARSNLDAENVSGLIDLFSKDVFKADHGGADLIGRVYEYFIGEFADSEGKRGGEFFTSVSIVKLLAAMLEPTEGKVFDPCCGSGGMFVQSDAFAHHNKKLSFYGQESKEFNYRLCLMNLFIHGIWGNIKVGNSYWDDQHADLKADYILANPPFNDGSKGEHGWGANRVDGTKDARLALGGERMPLSPRNANTMWILHFLHHLSDGGTAGFVLATGELSNNQAARLTVRKTLIEHDYVDCIVQLAGRLFANTQIPCSLWFLSRNREGMHGYRQRTGQILFIEGRRLGTLIPGSRTQKQLADDEIERIAATYRKFKRDGEPDATPGFCRVVSLKEVREHHYALSPGRYVETEDRDEDDEPFDERFPRLVAQLEKCFADSAPLEAKIRGNLSEIVHAE